MKRRVSMAVLGLAIAGTSGVLGPVAIAAERGPPEGRGAGQQESSGASHRERGPDGQRDGRRGETPRRDGPRGEGVPGWRDERRGDGRDDARQGAPRGERGEGRRDDRGWNDSRRDGRTDHDGRHGHHDRNDRDDRDDRDDGNRREYRDGRGWRDERGRDWHYSRDWYDRYRADHFRYDRGRYLARQRFSIGIYFLPRGYAPRYWQRGQWLPASHYGERRYHLLDYRRFDLYDPPFGARWVRVGSDALLVDHGSGEVLDVVFELFW